MDKFIQSIKDSNKEQLDALSKGTLPDMAALRDDRAKILQEISLFDPEQLTPSMASELKKIIRDIEELKAAVLKHKAALQTRMTQLNRGKTTIRAYGGAGYKKPANRVMSLKG